MAPQSQSSFITVLPGDDVTSYIRPSTPNNSNNNKALLKLGIGLVDITTTCSAQPLHQKITATLAGRLHHDTTTKTWSIVHNSKRFIPQVHDRVLGIVQDRIGQDASGDVYHVHIIGTPHYATLNNLQFEGASKRNKPQFNRGGSGGALVYARVMEMTPGGGVVLSCILGPQDAGVPRKDWMTEEALYGPLKGGTVIKISLGLAKELLDPNNVVLEELGDLPFEVAIGVNGLLWIHSKRPEYTIMIQNAILNSEVLTEEQTRGMVRKLKQSVKQQLENQESSDDDHDDGMEE